MTEQISSEEAELHSRLSSFKRKEEAAVTMTKDALNRLQGSDGGYLSFSGGKDSTVILHMALQVNNNIPICFFESDLEFPENIAYMQSLSEAWGFSLRRLFTSSLLDVFIDEGWFNHYRDGRDTGKDLHHTKITEPASRANQTFGTTVLWGMRADESKRRSALLVPGRGIVRYNDGRVAIAPLWNWSNIDVIAYSMKHRLPLNPIYKKMQELGVPEKDQRVGSIFDGANIDNGRMKWLKRGWYREYDKLRLSLPRIEEFS